jgi:hypothetical protein
MAKFMSMQLGCMAPIVIQIDGSEATQAPFTKDHHAAHPRRLRRIFGAITARFDVRRIRCE